MEITKIKKMCPNFDEYFHEKTIGRTIVLDLIEKSRQFGIKEVFKLIKKISFSDLGGNILLDRHHIKQIKAELKSKND